MAPPPNLIQKDDRTASCIGGVRRPRRRRSRSGPIVFLALWANIDFMRFNLVTVKHSGLPVDRRDAEHDAREARRG